MRLHTLILVVLIAMLATISDAKSKKKSKENGKKKKSKTCALPETLWEDLQRSQSSMSHFPLECLPSSIHKATQFVSQYWDKYSTPNCRVTSAHIVEGHRVIVYDGCIPEAYRDFMFQKFTYGDNFQCTQSDQPETAEHAYYTENHPVDIMKTGYGEAMLHLTKSIFGCRMEATKIYTNAMQFGDALFAHTDATGMTPGIETHDFATALTYTNPEWGIDWGGETVFYTGRCFDVKTGKLNKNGEIITSVLPKPGRVAIFDARVRHSGRPPQKIFLGRRFTTAMKLNCPWKTPPLVPYNKEYFENEAEIRKATLTAADRVPGRIRPRYDLRESLREL
jgi:hypothetical protein